jgi:hypothetical protein
MSSTRRSVIFLAVVAGLLLVLFVVGVGGGAAHHDSSDALSSTVHNWQGGFDPAAPVAASDLKASGQCTVDPVQSVARIAGPCRLSVPATSRFSLRPSRKLVVEPHDAGITFVYTVEGQKVQGSVEMQVAANLSFGRAAADVDVFCSGIAPCVVQIRK